MLKKISIFASMILGFTSNVVFAAGSDSISTRSYLNIDAVAAVFVLILALTIYIRVNGERTKQYDNLKNRK